MITTERINADLIHVYYEGPDAQNTNIGFFQYIEGHWMCKINVPLHQKIFLMVLDELRLINDDNIQKGDHREIPETKPYHDSIRSTIEMILQGLKVKNILIPELNDEINHHGYSLHCIVSDELK